MANEYDKIFKENIEELLPFVVAKLLGIGIDQLEEIPDDVQTTVERKPDFLKKVNDPAGVYLLHIEFQSKRDYEMPYRMLEYYALLLRQYRIPVRQVVLQIGRPVSTRTAQLTTEILRFRYRLLNLRDVDYDVFLSSQQPEEIILAVLANFRGTEPRKVLTWLLEKLKVSVGPQSHRFEKFANQLLVLAKLRNLETETFNILETMPISLGINIEDMYSFKRGEKKGKQEVKKEIVLNLHQLNQLNVSQIAAAVNESVAFVKRVIAQRQVQ